MKCTICNLEASSKNSDLCSTCRRLVYQDIRGSRPSFWAVIEAVQNLEYRIPDLFIGPECPGNCCCSCNYKDGCKLLKKSIDKKKI